MSSSGKGQSTARTAEDVGAAWDYAVEKMRGDRPRVIVEEFIAFDSEITLLTVATKDGVLFCAPVGHRQEAGDYRESWQPAASPRRADLGAEPGAQGRRGARRSRHLRRRILHPRRASDLLRTEPAPARYRHGHADFPVAERVRAALARDPRAADPSIEFAGPSASAVILASEDSESFCVRGRGRRARAGRTGAAGRPAHFRQAQDAEEPPHGGRPRPRRDGRRCGRARGRCSFPRPDSLSGLRRSRCAQAMHRVAAAILPCGLQPAAAGPDQPARSRSAAPTRTSFTGSTR